MKKGYIYIILSTILFSTMEIALHLTAGDFNPVQITFLRFLIGALVLMVPAFLVLKKRNYKLTSKDWAFFALTGFICVVISMMLYQLAILYAPASIVAVLFSCNPVFVIIFAYAMLHEKVFKHTIVSIIVSFIGIIVIMNPFHMSASVAGITLSILAAVTFALYGVVGRAHSENYGGVVLTCFSFLAGSIELLALIFVTNIGAVSTSLTNSGFKMFASVNIFQGINLQALPGLIYIGIFVTGLGYVFYFLAMECTSAATASLVFFIKPALAPIFALIILGEPITVTMTAGILLIITGSLISFIPGLRSKKTSENSAEEDTLETESIE